MTSGRLHGHQSKVSRLAGWAAILALVALWALCAAASATPSLPPANAGFDYQIGGAYRPAASVRIVDRDRGDDPAPGRYNICYLNAFQTQTDEAAWWKGQHRGLLLTRRGRYVIDAAWNEIVLDISTPAKRRALAAIVGRWIDGCRRAGFQAIEPDNLDSYTRSRGALTAADAKAFARLLTARAHAAGMAIAQKNAAEFAPAGQSLGFDFAIAEECNVYHECGAYTKAYGARVFEIEYPDNGGVENYQAACEGRGKRISIVYRDRAVVPRGRSGYQFRGC